MTIEPDPFSSRRRASLDLDDDDLTSDSVEETTISSVDPGRIDLHTDGLCSHCNPLSPSWEHNVQCAGINDIFLEGLEFPEIDAVLKETNQNSAGLCLFIDLVDKFSAMKSSAWHDRWSNLCSAIKSVLSFPRRHLACEFEPHVLKRVIDLRQILRIPLSHEIADVELVHRYDRLLPSQQAAVNQAVLAIGPKVDLRVTFGSFSSNQAQHPTEVFLNAITDFASYNKNHRNDPDNQPGVIDRLRALVQRYRIERFLRDPDFINQTAESLYVFFGVEIAPADPALAAFIRLPREQQRMVKARIHRARWNALNAELPEKIPCPFDTMQGAGVTLDLTN